MTVYRYTVGAVVLDYLRGLGGMAICIGALVLAPASPYALGIFGGLTVLFLLFTIRTGLRQRQWVEAGDETICSHGVGGERLAWRDIDHVSLRYYSTRRSREGGWMTLKMGAGGRRLSIDSGLDGFDVLAARAAAAARANNLALQPATVANFAALGIAAGDHVIVATPGTDRLGVAR